MLAGAHHSDLMFENAEDAADVKAARALERECVCGLKLLVYEALCY